MIKFACTCHAVLEVSDDFAGSSLQCPKCKRLVDVPNLSDLQSLTEDGTYKMGNLKLRDEPDRLAKLQRAFGKARVDENGNEIDLREQYHEDAIPLEDDDVLEIAAEPVAPKYDPVTGELVRSMPLRQEPVKFDPSTIPMAKAVINYASATSTREFSGWRIFPEIFKFTNIAVMGIILIIHMFIQLMAFPLAVGLWIVIPGFVVLVFALIAHYANVVQDIGIDNSDELPRPLRDLSWHDDIWGPFVNFAVAGGLCYGPIVFYHRFPPMAAFAYVMTVLVLGTIAFPAIFLTTATSGTILNLMPDRILRVISATGVKYLFVVALWAVTAFVYIVGIFGSIVGLLSLFMPVSSRVFGVPVPLVVGYAMLLIGIIMMHGFCWYLGLIYRAHYDQFDWFLQRHHKKIETVRAPRGMTIATPAMAPPMAKPIATPPASGKYPQSHA